MSKPWFTIEQLNQIKNTFENHPDYPTNNMVGDVRNWLIAELTKPESQRNVGQIYIAELGHPYKHRGTSTQTHSRFITTLEAGEECMEHLLDAIATIAEYTTENTINAFIFQIIHKALAKHKELMK